MVLQEALFWSCFVYRIRVLFFSSVPSLHVYIPSDMATIRIRITINFWTKLKKNPQTIRDECRILTSKPNIYLSLQKIYNNAQGWFCQYYRKSERWKVNAYECICG